MPDDTPSCPACNNPLDPDTHLCNDCRRTLRIAIANVGFYHADLTTLRVGQTRYGQSSSNRNRSEGHLGMDTRFDRKGIGTRLLADVDHTAARWLVRIAAATPDPWSVTAACRILNHHTDRLNAHALREFTALEQRLVRVVDRPPDLWYAGICSEPLGEHDGSTCDCRCHQGPFQLCSTEGGCGMRWADHAPKCEAHLYATRDTGIIRCRVCGTKHPVADRRALLLDYAEDMQATAAEAARAIALLDDGYDGTAGKLADRIRQWAARGRILSGGEVDMPNPKGGDPLKRPTYRVGDILDLLNEDARSRARRTVKQAV